MKKITIFASVLLIASLNVNAQTEADYTVPSWTLYQRTVQAGNPDNSVLVSKDYPYNVNVTVNGDPTSQFGASWFTNAGVTGTKLQLKAGNTSDFSGAREINATPVVVNDLVYIANSNNNTGIANSSGFAKGVTRSYISNKAVISGLQANTTYSYRVGGVNGAWSQTGTFTTAKANKDDFEFIYITDTQANTDEMFDVSKKTVEAAHSLLPNAKFLLCTGDFVETYHIPGYEDYGYSGSAEWEWEQWFEKMQSSWLQLPIVPVQGNHDISPTHNWFHHFNTDTLYNTTRTGAAKTNMNGTVYSFVYGDALFMVINFENIPLPYVAGDDNETYINGIAEWLRAQAAAHTDVKWKIVAFHKSMFTGSSSHQDDGDGRFVRERIAPVLQEIGADFAIQAHDHIYEVIGVINVDNTAEGIRYTHLPNAVSDQQTVTPTYADGTVNCAPSESVTGKNGGTFDVSEGALYFLNNSAGQKKYYPRSEEQMNAAFDKHGVSNFFSLFNKFGQTSEPTFSSIKVSTDAITVSTYTVDNEGTPTLFDAFKIVKSDNQTGLHKTVSASGKLTLYPNPASDNIIVETPEKIESIRIFSINGQEIISQKDQGEIDLSGIASGVYILSVKTADNTYTERFVVRK
ncbi:T9SS type A sorting domain-containing protein [Viscerimonas tarda]